MAAPTPKSTAAPQALSPREILTRDTFTSAETAVFTMVVLLLALASWLPPAAYWWVFGMGLILAALNPAVARLHELTHPFFISHLWRKWFLLQLPFWLLLVYYLMGLLNPSLQPIGTTTNQQELLALAPPSAHWPTVPSAGVGWQLIGQFAGAYLVSVMLFMVPKSRAFFLRLLPWLGLNAVLLALLGYLQRAFGIEKIIGIFEPGNSRYFATFGAEAQWLAFALLWAGVLAGLCLLHYRLEKQPGDFVRGMGPWFGCGSLVLLGSGLLCDAGMAQVYFWLAAAALFACFGWFFIRAKQTKSNNAAAVWIVPWLLVAVGCVVLAWQRWQLHMDTQPYAMATAWEMLSARPWLGWGADSFAWIAPFFHSDFSDPSTTNATSDILLWLTAFGWLGSLLILGLPLLLLLKDALSLLRFRLSCFILTALAGLFAIASVQSVLDHYAVAMSFWLLFFVALRWSHISRTEADRVDQTPYLIFPKPQRRT